MRSTAIEVHHPPRERERRRPHLGAQLQTSVLVDRLRAGEALRLADRQCSSVRWCRAAGGR
jgi:hypothetical protein